MSIICKDLNWLLVDQDSMEIPPIEQISDTVIAMLYATAQEEMYGRGLLVRKDLK